jgi:type I restriction enzyme S subunit
MLEIKFKQTELGEIPEGWEEYLFSEIIEVDPKRELRKGTQAKFVSMADLKEFDKKIQGFITREFKGGSKFVNEDTLMARITPCLENGKTAFVDILEREETGSGSTEFIVLAAKEDKTIPEFVYYLAISPEIRTQAIQSMTGTSGRQRVERDVFDKIVISIPKVSEQRVIAKILSDLDEKIELNRQMNKTLESIAQAIFKRLFMDEDKDATIGKLGDILDMIESGSRPKGGIDPNLSEGIPSIGAENIDGIGCYDYSKTRYVPIDFFNTMNRGIVKDYDVLVYKDGAYIGRKSMFGNGFPYEKCCVNEHVFILRSNNRVNQFFLYFLLNQTELKQLNTNSAQPGLNQESMKSWCINIPAKIKIDRFGEIVKPLVDGIFYNCNQSRNLSQIRDSLLPRLMAGKIRIKEV